MYARLTRYEGGSPDAIEDALETKKNVLPTEYGQTEGMKGTVFLVNRDSRHDPRHVPVGERRSIDRERSGSRASSRRGDEPRRNSIGGPLRGGDLRRRPRSSPGPPESAPEDRASQSGRR